MSCIISLLSFNVLCVEKPLRRHFQCQIYFSFFLTGNDGRKEKYNLKNLKPKHTKNI